MAEQYLKKGAKVYIEGQLQTRKWQDQSGQERYTTEVVLQGFGGQLTMLDGRGGPGMQESGQGDYDSGPSSGGYREQAPARGGGKGKPGGFDKALDDEIPF